MNVVAPVRLRQVVVVTRDLLAVAPRLRDALQLPEPFVDPGVGDFGLENRVFAAGDCFIEILAPIRDSTAGGRYLERRGGDAGYMAIFQLADLDAARRRVADLGIRVVWQADLEDISGTHLHPADVPGAIVSLDRADPPGSWHWAGPRWRGGQPADRAPGGVTALTIQAADPQGMARRWADVLGVAAPDGAGVQLADAGQELRFVDLPVGATPKDEGIIGVELELALPATTIDVAGVRFDVKERQP
ncbi:MAG TPA: hypothetical protein VM143_18190 [Acidimicrobiales bacterium]|nr:hypothetical protein [Acidimicrobiales bacterium]